VRAGAVSHGIGLYAHDIQAQNAFFRYGFGQRCADAVRPIARAAMFVPVNGFVCKELPKERAAALFPLYSGLQSHLSASPSYMYYGVRREADFAEMVFRQKARYFAMERDGQYTAYIKVMEDGETFAAEDASMANICGAFCLPAYRGTGAFASLLQFVSGQLAAEGFTRLGVDFESFNPTAWGFWTKHFTPYTLGMVRRIDENILDSFGAV